MIKKVVIAAAGAGTRMLHLTNNKPKHLIKVQKKPFLAYLLDNVFKAGYKDIILVIGYKGELVKEFLKEYEKNNRFKGKIKIVCQFDILGPKEKIYGTACSLMCVKDGAKEQFLFICGDNLYSVKDLKEMNIDDQYNYVAGFNHPRPEKYGVLITDDGFLKKIIEKPKKYVGNLINTGMYKFTPEVFGKLSEIKKSPRGEYEITDAVSLLAKEKKVKVKKIKDYWLDFGNPADIIKLSRFLKKNGY
ncbi:MAG: hypothetical protein FJZ07_02065 [Candidatus Nealsonbacteria bacterium]|nr:hypothetical protein [Candidatus Nealsonbacteria bacterium]